MFLVILYHGCLFWGDIGWFCDTPVYSSRLLKVFAFYLNSFHVQAFTLVSGYLFYYLRYEDKHYHCFKAFFYNKVKRLLVPYVFISIVWVVPISVYFFHYDVTRIVRKYILATGPSQLWFLWMLFDVFMIVYALSERIKKSNLFSLILATGLTILGMIGWKFIPNIFCILISLTYTVFFIIGFKIRQYGRRLIDLFPTYIWFLIHLILYFIVTYLQGNHSITYKIVFAGFNVLLPVVGAIMAFVILQDIANRFDWERSQFIKEFSQKSMTIYLLHQQIIYFTINWLNGYFNAYFHATINFVVATLGAYIIANYMYKYKCVRILLGEKV